MSKRIGLSIPVRNDYEWLPAMFRSLDDQGEWPRVAFMDATSDETIQNKIKKWGRRFDYLRHGPDEGQAAAINEGWAKLDADILGWLNADDYLYPGALDRVLRAFDENPDIDVVFGPATFVGEQGDYIGPFPAFDPDPAALMQGCSIAQPACFVRRRAAQAVGYLDPTLHYAMDWDFWRKLYWNGARFMALDEPLAVMRQRMFSKTYFGGLDRLKEIWRVAMRGEKAEGLRSWMGFATEEAFLRAHWTVRAGNQILRFIRGRGLGETPEAGIVNSTKLSFSYPCYDARKKTSLSAIVEGAALVSVTLNGETYPITAVTGAMVKRGAKTITAKTYWTEDIPLPRGMWHVTLTFDSPGGRFHGLNWF